jgi:uncharacterized protein YbjT (DUF2867 family)
VTGGTGTLGRLMVPRLRDAGYDLRVLSRHRPGDGEGDGVDRDGANLSPDRAVGQRTWEDFLAARLSTPSDTGPVPA